MEKEKSDTESDTDEKGGGFGAVRGTFEAVTWAQLEADYVKRNPKAAKPAKPAVAAKPAPAAAKKAKAADSDDDSTPLKLLPKKAAPSPSKKAKSKSGGKPDAAEEKKRAKSKDGGDSKVAKKPPLNVHDIKNAKQFQKWYKWVKQVWAQQSKQRNPKGKKKVSKQSTLTSPPRKKTKTEGKSDSKADGKSGAAGTGSTVAAALAAAMAKIKPSSKSAAAADKKLGQTADTELPEWNATRPPEPHTCFAPLPFDSVDALITVYDFVTTYGNSVFKVPKETGLISVEDLIACLCVPFETHTVNNFFTALVRGALAPAKSARELKAGKKKKEELGRVICGITWQEYLRQHLTTLNATFWKTEIAALASGTFWTALNVQRRTALMEFLCNEITKSGSLLRDHWESSENDLSQAKAAAIKERNQLVSEQAGDDDGSKKAAKEVTSLMVSMIDKLYAEDPMYQQDALSAMPKTKRGQLLNQEKEGKQTAQERYTKIFKKDRERAIERRLKQITAEEQAVKDRYKKRHQVLGTDRYSQQYFKFGRPNRLYVYNSTIKTWGYYESPEELKSLMKWLNQNGQREYALFKALSKDTLSMKWAAWTVPEVPHMFGVPHGKVERVWDQSVWAEYDDGARRQAAIDAEIERKRNDRRRAEEERDAEDAAELERGKSIFGNDPKLYNPTAAAAAASAGDSTPLTVKTELTAATGTTATATPTANGIVNASAATASSSSAAAAAYPPNGVTAVSAAGLSGAASTAMETDDEKKRPSTLTTAAAAPVPIASSSSASSSASNSNNGPRDVKIDTKDLPAIFRYTNVFDSYKFELRAFTLKLANSDEYARCSTCQEPYLPTEERHCEFCHKTVTLKQRREWAGFDEHLKECALSGKAAINDALMAVSENFKVIKALILDLEAAIPTEAVLHNNAKMRQGWIDRTKQALTIDELGKSLYEVETNTRPEWTRPWHNSGMYRRAITSGVMTESHLAQLTFILDQAICYNEDEQKGNEELRAQIAEDEAAAAAAAASVKDDDDDIVADACQVCHGTGDDDQTLLCDVCDAEYHMFCLNPPLTRMPRGEWVCPRCRGKKGKKRAGSAAAPTRDGASTRQISRQEIAAVSGSSSRRGAAAAASGGGRQTAASLRAAAFAMDDDDSGAFSFPRWDPDNDTNEDSAGTEFALPDKWTTVDSLDAKAIDKLDDILLASADNCGICGSAPNSTQIILCDLCDGEYHLSCVGLGVLPDGEWFCPDCIRNGDSAQTPKGGKAAAVSKTRGKRKAAAESLYTEDDDEDDDAEAGDDDDAVVEGGDDDDDADGDGEGESGADENCRICNGGSSEEGNLIVICDGCEMPLHQLCYGVSAEAMAEEKWHCDTCKDGLKQGQISCALCPNKEGAFKQSAKDGGQYSGIWVHVACAQWIPGMKFGSEETRSPVTGFDKVKPKYWDATCEICNQKFGACVQCTGEGPCERYFHATCGLTSEKDNSDYAFFHLNRAQHSCCPEHKPSDAEVEITDAE